MAKRAGCATQNPDDAAQAITGNVLKKLVALSKDPVALMLSKALSDAYREGYEAGIRAAQEGGQDD